MTIIHRCEGCGEDIKGNIVIIIRDNLERGQPSWWGPMKPNVQHFCSLNCLHKYLSKFPEDLVRSSGGKTK